MFISFLLSSHLRVFVSLFSLRSCFIERLSIAYVPLAFFTIFNLIRIETTGGYTL